MEDGDATSTDRVENLLDRASRGEREAIAELYRLYERGMIAAVHRRLGGTLHGLMESVDIVQSTWKDVLREIPSFENRGPESFRRWLYACLENKIRTKARYHAAEKRAARRIEDPAGGGSESHGVSRMAGDDPTPRETASGREDLERFLRILETFPEIQRHVLLYRMRDGLSYHAIGKLVGKSSEAVRKIYDRARGRLFDRIRPREMPG